MQKIRKKSIGISFIIFLSVMVWIHYTTTTTCILCDNLRYHAPCLVSLSTGEMAELELYQPHPSKVAEIVPEKTGGVFRLLRIAGATGYADTTEPIVKVTLPTKQAPIEKRHFCKSCRKLLANCTQQAFALVDMYEAGAPRILPLTDGAFYEIRCYEVFVHRTGSQTEITVRGTAIPAAA